MNAHELAKILLELPEDTWIVYPTSEDKDVIAKKFDTAWYSKLDPITKKYYPAKMIILDI